MPAHARMRVHDPGTGLWESAVDRRRLLHGAWVASLATLSARPRAAGPGDVAGADARRVRAVVQAQLDAFAARDAKRAFSTRAPGSARCSARRALPGDGQRSYPGDLPPGVVAFLATQVPRRRRDPGRPSHRYLRSLLARRLSPAASARPQLAHQRLRAARKPARMTCRRPLVVSLCPAAPCCRGMTMRPRGMETMIFLKNCWYVAAWDHELIDGKLLARTILEQPVLLYRGESGAVVALDDRCCHRGALLSKGRLEGDCVRCMYHGLKFDADRQVHPDPRPGHDPAEARRAQLPGGRARPPRLDLDGRSGEGRSGADPRLPVPARPAVARHARLHALRRELAADRRQPERLRAPRVRAHEDARRLRGVRLRDQADRRSSGCRAAFASSAGT